MRVLFVLLSLSSVVSGQQTYNASALAGRLNSFSFASVEETPMPAGPAGSPEAAAMCWVVNGVDYTGTDVGNKPSQTAEGCCDLCKAFGGCGAFTWTNHNGGTCWLKSEQGTAITAPDARSAVVARAPPPATCFAVEKDVDFSGKLLTKAFSANAEGCCDECDKISGCAAYTWTGLNGGTCWLQDAASTRKFATGAHSAVMRRAPQCVLAGNADFAGNDVANRPGKTPTECCDICSKTTNCKAFTWTDYNGGTCWLKSAAAARTATPNAVSGSFAVV